MIERLEKLPTRLKLMWGSGALGVAVLMNSISILILFYLINVVGLDPGLAGTIVFASKLFDVATDPIMGVISDRSTFRRGRRRPFLVVGAFISALAFGMLFTIPEFSTQAASAAYALAALLLYTLGYTIFNVPYMAMPAEMTDGYHERSSLHSYRVVFVSIGSSIAGAIAPILLQVFGEGREAYRIVALLFSAIIFASMVGCYFGTREARFTFTTRTAHSVKAQIGLLFDNKPFLWLISTKALQLIGIASAAATTLFYITAYLQIPLAHLAVFGLINTIVTILMMPVFVRLSKRFGKRAAYAFSTSVLIIYSLSWALAQPTDHITLFYARGILVGICMGGNILLAMSMLTDTIDFDFRRTGMRREGIYAACYSFVEKFSGAFGPLIVGWVLAFVGFNRNLPPDAVQEPQVLFGILVGMAFIPAAAAALSLLTLSRYRLDESMLARTKTIAEPDVHNQDSALHKAHPRLSD
ncbi:MAG: MFS transporter [Gammaproteobacteria bacterium]|nr:MFS transporter [Gammaproteobacteria bacterium]